jgi:hypothetical protein
MDQLNDPFENVVRRTPPGGPAQRALDPAYRSALTNVTRICYRSQYGNSNVVPTMGPVMSHTLAFDFRCD